MLKFLRNNKAQAVSGEYVMVIFLMMAVMISMTIYFKRAVQARIHDARDYMVFKAAEETMNYFNGSFYLEYEPYYANTSAIVNRFMDDQTSLLGGGSSGIFRKDYDETISVTVNSETAPPRDFNRIGPVY